MIRKKVAGIKRNSAQAQENKQWLKITPKQVELEEQGAEEELTSGDY